MSAVADGTRWMAGRVRVWAVIAAAVAGCSAAPVREAPSVATAGAKAPAAPPPAATARFRIAPEGLPKDGFWKSTPLVADVNRDGFADIVVHPRLAKGPRVLLGNGKGQWTDSSRGLEMERSCGGGMQLADVNRDGHLDLVVADHCAAVFVFLGDGKGGWTSVTQGLSTEFSRSKVALDRDPGGFKGTEAVAVGDVDGDGMLDLVVSSTDNGGLTVYLGDGTGRNWRERKNAGLPNGEHSDPGDAYFGGWAFDLELRDMNGDGRLDVVASYYTGPRVWLGDGTGGFKDGSQGLVRTSLGGIYGRLATGDLNGDGRPDLVIANNVNGAEAYQQKADGSWQGPIDVMPELKGGAQSVALADLDGDGSLDVIIGGMASSGPNREWVPFGLFVRWGDGRGAFSRRLATNLPEVGLEVIWGIKAVDLNGDGRPDIVVGTGGATGKIVDSGQSTRMRTQAVTQKSQPVPNVQVWLNEGVARP